MSEDGAPRFIENLGDPQLPPPFLYKGLAVRSFPLLADLDKLQKVCDRYLNFASDELGAVFVPLAPLVYLQLNTYPFMASAVREFRKLGFLTQNELTFTLPVVETRSGIPRAIYFFSPYVFVDNDWSIVAGRNILGFPKVLGRFEIPPQASDPYPSRLEARAFAVLARDTRLRFRRVLEIREKTTDKELPGIEDPSELWPFGPVDQLFGADDQISVDDAYLRLIEEAVGAARIPLIQLAQFRDPVDPKVASYQALVGCSLTRLSFRDGGLLAPAVIDVDALESLPFAKVLGLLRSKKKGGTLEPILPFWYVLDTELSDTRNLLVRSAA